VSDGGSAGGSVPRLWRRIGTLAALRTAAALAAILLLGSSGAVLAGGSSEGAGAEAAPPPRLWTSNMYDASLARLQNPDWQACTAAATESMLNMIAMTSSADTPPPRGSSLPLVSMTWHVTTSYEAQEAILGFERDNMTMYWGAPGTDPHGWRNALNYYGWGSMSAGVYVDSAFDSFDAAAHQAVHSIARTGKPVGILAWYGGHAQYVTGYQVVGEDPRVSDDFKIVGVYLSDPFEADDAPNVFLSYDAWQNGSIYLRFVRYYQDNSPFQDPIDGQVGYREWWGKWVIIDAVK
jgi:hypothetical protein